MAVLAFARGAPFSVTTMIVEVFPVVAPVTFIAKVRFAEESRNRAASVVMSIFFDETNNLARSCGGIPIKDDHMGWINRHDLDAVLRQGGLKSFKFGDTTRSFGKACSLVKLFGSCFLDGAALSEIVVVLVSCVSISVCQDFHCDDGACTAQVVLILDGDTRFFHDTAHGSAARFVSFAVSTARSRGAYEGGLHGESVVGCELFVGVQFPSESLEIRVQSFAAFLKFDYGEGGGLEGVIEGIGLHGEVDGMRRQGIVRLDLTFNGSSESSIIGGSNVSTLLQDGFIPLSVHDISPVSSCPCGSKVKV